jgi:hypothetical protein
MTSQQQRPTITDLNAEIRRLHATGLSALEIAKQLGIPYSFVVGALE